MTGGLSYISPPLTSLLLGEDTGDECVNYRHDDRGINERDPDFAVLF
jgi:hypothetical protein